MYNEYSFTNLQYVDEGIKNKLIALGLLGSTLATGLPVPKDFAHSKGVDVPQPRMYHMLAKDIMDNGLVNKETREHINSGLKQAQSITKKMVGNPLSVPQYELGKKIEDSIHSKNSFTNSIQQGFNL